MSETSLVVRRLEDGDVSRYRDIRLESLLLAPEAYGSSHEMEAAQPTGWFAERLTGSTVFGAFLDGELTGIAAFAVQDGAKRRHKGHLWGVYVRPAARGLGVARAVCARALDAAEGRVELVQLSVTDGNAHARKLYENLGFEVWGIEKQARIVNGTAYDDVHMVKYLVPQ